MLPLCGNTTPLHIKADDSLLTAGDLEAEGILVRGLQQHFPGEAIRSEECGNLGSGSTLWVVDPIDGTSAFTEGLAHWGPTVGRYVDGKLSCGALYLPRLNEFFYVDESGGWLNQKLLAPLSSRKLPQVIYLPSRFHRYCETSFKGKGRCLGGTAPHLANIARGAASGAFVAPGWSLWDTAAGLGLIEAVGGVAVRYPDGEPLDPVRDEGVAFLAGSPELVADFIQQQRVTIRSEGSLHART